MLSICRTVVSNVSIVAMFGEGLWSPRVCCKYGEVPIDSMISDRCQTSRTSPQCKFIFRNSLLYSVIYEFLDQSQRVVKSLGVWLILKAEIVSFSERFYSPFQNTAD